jgi:hypothetical protein
VPFVVAFGLSAGLENCFHMRGLDILTIEFLFGYVFCYYVSYFSYFLRLICNFGVPFLPQYNYNNSDILISVQLHLRFKHR